MDAGRWILLACSALLAAACGSGTCDAYADVIEQCGVGSGAYTDADREACKSRLSTCSGEDTEKLDGFFGCVDDQARCDDGEVGDEQAFLGCTSHLEGLSQDCSVLD